MMLKGVNIDSMTGLHVPVGEDWKTYMEKLSGRFSKARLMIVIVTPAYFKSKPCLEELFHALDKGYRIEYIYCCHTRILCSYLHIFIIDTANAAASRSAHNSCFV